ncbi:coiled-coil domain-containing protein 106-like isoform X1 [Pygocentrus nattereri]|uniref:coiled-coil domain-containing protein 106-like isoform X1 n=1 Tax=Pygocentrus nattereri TaxID=42514 RepID=UPI001891E14E|nr:coiled-coil domain-containing protein 106-like isoform X1 [Pygocentrus nattereri]
MDNPVTVNDSESSDTSSMSSSSTTKKCKHKSKKKHSKGDKDKKEQKFRQRVKRFYSLSVLSCVVQTSSEIVRYYKSILKTLPKARTITRAFQKHAIDRNTVVSTSVTGKLTIAAPEAYEEVLAKKPCGETVLAFA